MDQQWCFRLGVFGVDLQTERQINATPRGEIKNPTDPESRRPALALNKYVMYRDDLGRKKGNLILKV